MVGQGTRKITRVTIRIWFSNQDNGEGSKEAPWLTIHQLCSFVLTRGPRAAAAGGRVWIWQISSGRLVAYPGCAFTSRRTPIVVAVLTVALPSVVPLRLSFDGRNHFAGNRICSDNRRDES